MFTRYIIKSWVFTRQMVFYMANKNPKIDQIKAYTFKTERKESCTAQLNLRVPPSLLLELKKKDNWQELVRQAIAEKLQSA